MNKKIFLVTGVFILVIVFVFVVLNKQSQSKKQVTNLRQAEEKVGKDLGIKEGKINLPSYSGAVVDDDKCGKDAFYIRERSADFVKNYCKFLRDNGWKLVHQDYPNCEDIKSFGGGYNYEKGQEKVAVSVIRYGEDATCFSVFKR